MNDKNELIRKIRDLEKELLLKGIENEKQEYKIRQLKKEIETLKEIPQISCIGIC